jgi:LysR family transcriptional regulator, cys regulon transcriptional activator
MNFQQLRIIRETVRRDYNLTEVANSLYTSQSGVSKHIKELEAELGVELFYRKGKRLLGMTEPGKEMLRYVERMLLDAANIKNIAEQYSQQDEGQLTVATTHTQARYALPAVVVEFKKQYPRVHLKLHQGSPVEIASLLLSGEADIGVATETLGDVAELASFPYYRWHHAVIVPEGHALLSVGKLTLQQIADYPIVTYHEGFTGRAVIEKSFKEADIKADIVLSALDADVIKSYVMLGMGIGIVASVSVDEQRDPGIRKLDCSHLFAENTSRIAVHKGHLLRRFAYQFIEMCSGDLTEVRVKAESNQDL